MSPLLIALLLASPDSVTAPRSHASITYGFEAFTEIQPTWQSANGQVGHRFDHGTLIGELLAAQRFGFTDEGLAVDAYHSLWPRAYGNFRTQVVPGAAVLPLFDVATELFQSLAGGVELSGGYRRMQYENDRADLWSAGVAVYSGNWYVRAKALMVPRAGRTGTSGSLTVRRYLTTADDYLDVQGGVGEELQTVGSNAAGPIIDVTRNRFFAVRLRKFLTPRLGASVGATFNGAGSLPDRRGLNVSVISRW